MVDDPRTLRDPAPADSGVRTNTSPEHATLVSPKVSATGDTELSSAVDRPPPSEPLEALAATAIVDPTRYVIRSELARGGMGRISIADDRVLGRPVAMKEVLVDSADHHARFQRELMLTARLQHPGIVSVHDGGTWPDGKLVYIMRLVSGEPLEVRIARATTAEQRMALLPNVIAAVDALAYAHSQGIIHRDLKPANVLLGDFGETVVIDWGLAKDLRSPTPEPGGGGASGPPISASGSGPETVDGDVIGTPAYMPPEQARGGRSVDERADVYALGALLYHVLAGVPPYGGRSVEVLAAVIAGPPVPLGERAPEIPRDLLAIVERAMAVDPDARYRSAAELGSELKRFQNGQLVAAHRYTAWQLARRWIRKRRAPVAVGLVAIAALAVGAIVSVRRIVAEQERATDALALAEHHHAEAVRRGADAERLLDFMIFQLHDKLEPLGRLDLLAGLAQTMQTYYADHVLGAPEDERRRARARENLANVLRAKGDAPGALREHEAALATLAGLAARAPNDRALQIDLATSYVAASGHRIALGKGLEALDAATRATQIAAQVLAAAPEDPAALRLAVNAHVALGNRQEERGEITTALDTYRTALATAARLATAGDPEANELVSLCHRNVGDALIARGETAGALDEYRAALALDSAEVARHPENTVLASRIVFTYAKVADALLDRDEHDAAIGMFRQAQSVARALSARDPENAAWRRQLSVIQVRLGSALLVPETAEQALVELQTARDIRLQLAERDAANTEWQRDLMVAHTKVAAAEEALGQTAAAKIDYEKARVLGEQVATTAADLGTAQRDLVIIYGGLGRVLDTLGESDAALRWLRAGLALSQRVVGQPTDVKPEDYWGLSQVMEMLADTLAHRGDRAGADAMFEEAIALARARRAAEPQKKEWDGQIQRLEESRAAAKAKRR